MSIVHYVFKFFAAFKKKLTIYFSFCIFFPFCLFLYACFLLVTFSHHLYPHGLLVHYMPTYSSVCSLFTCSLFFCLSFTYVICSSFVVYMCHLCCLLIACLRHMFVTYLHYLSTYMSLAKVPTKLVICSSHASLFIASFHVVLPPYLYVQVLKQKAGRLTIIQANFHWSFFFFPFVIILFLKNYLL